MPRVHGGHLVMKTLKREGVEHIFGIAAVSILPLYDACLDEGIRNIDTRHEASAVHMADGWARATGKPAFAPVTSRPTSPPALWWSWSRSPGRLRSSGAPCTTLIR